MAVINGVDYGGLDSVSAPAPGTFSTPAAAATSAAAVAGDVVTCLWILLAVEIVLLVGLRRSLRKHNGG